MRGFGKQAEEQGIEIEATTAPASEALVAAIESEAANGAADAALAEMDEAAAPMGPCLVVYGKDESVQFFPYNPETDVIAVGKQSNLTQLSLKEIQQIELGIVG